MKPYQAYRNLPPLAGLCSMEEAFKPGLSVDQCVTRLKRYHYAFKRLHHLLTAHITAEPILELKNAFSLQSYLCAEHVTAFRQRVGEMREPPLGLEEVPHPALEMFFDEILGATTTELLVLGIYNKALPALKLSLENHIRDTNRLADAPSVRLCRFALLEVNDMIKFGEAALASLQPKNDAWLQLLDDCLAACGGLDGTGPTTDVSPERQFSKKPYVFDPVPKRDERFPDPYNMGVNAEVFLYDPQ
jgi:hypothetical protein